MHRFSNSFFVTNDAERVFELHFDASMFPSNIAPSSSPSSPSAFVLINVLHRMCYGNFIVLLLIILLFSNWLDALLFDRIYIPSIVFLVSCLLFFLFFSCPVLFCSVLFYFIWYPECFTMALIHYSNHSIFTFSMPICDVAYIHLHIHT